MRALITGGAGFIGSHLAQHLLDQGNEVWVIDDLSTGSIENIYPLKHCLGFRYTIDTVTNIPASAELVDGCDVIFHLAAAVGVRLIVESPVRTMETNIRGTEIILDLAAKKRKLVVIASTSEVYGKSAKVPFCEDDDLLIGPPVKGRWSYACSKAIDEFLAISYWKERHLPVIIVRLFNTVGPRQTGRYGMVLPNFVDHALSGHDITVFGTGKQSRCFGSVHDVVEALNRLAATSSAVGQIFNVGNNEEVTIEGLAQRVRDATGSSSKIAYIPYEKAYEEGFEDMLRRVPSLEKIRQCIGYQPKMSLPGIIEEVVEYERARLSATDRGRSAPQL